MLNILMQDFFVAGVLNDPWSPYAGLTARWVDTTAIPTRMTQFQQEWRQMVTELGVPPGVIIQLAYPEVEAILTEWGVDIKELKNPEVFEALLKAGLFGGIPTDQQEEAEPEEESAVAA